MLFTKTFSIPTMWRAMAASLPLCQRCALTKAVVREAADRYFESLAEEIASGE